MALPDSQSRAPARTARIQNVPAAVAANKLPRKIVVVGTYNPALTAVVPNVPVRVFGGGDTGAQFGFGYMLHRQVAAVEKGSNGQPIYVIPQAEAAGAVAASGELVITGTTDADGFIYLYIGNDRIVIPIPSGSDPTDAGDIVEEYLSVAKNKELPLTGTNALGTVTTTNKTKGPWGNFVKIEINKGEGEELPSGMTGIAITQPTLGAGVPDIQDALDALGTGDAQNELHLTDGTDGYMMDTTTMDKVSTYNGIGDEDEGNYNPRVCRPFRWVHADTEPGTDGLTALLALSANRKLDRTNMVAGAPGSSTHPGEIAAEIVGAIAAINNNDPAQNYLGELLSVDPGPSGKLTTSAGRWTNDYPNRDQAMKEGIGFTLVENGVLTINKLVTFYRPDNVNPDNNGYRSARNISITQNILDNCKKYFDQDEWRQISIVKDSQKVSGVAKQKVRDEDAVLDALGSLADAFAGEAWLYDAEYTKENMTAEVRTAGNGFNNTFPVVYSGEGDIIDTQVNFDIALTVFTA